MHGGSRRAPPGGSDARSSGGPGSRTSRSQMAPSTCRTSAGTETPWRPSACPRSSEAVDKQVSRWDALWHPRPPIGGRYLPVAPAPAGLQPAGASSCLGRDDIALLTDAPSARMRMVSEVRVTGQISAVPGGRLHCRSLRPCTEAVHRWAKCCGLSPSTLIPAAPQSMFLAPLRSRSTTYVATFHESVPALSAVDTHSTISLAPFSSGKSFGCGSFGKAAARGPSDSLDAPQVMLSSGHNRSAVVVLGVIPLVFPLLVELPVLIEVPAGAQGA